MNKCYEDVLKFHKVFDCYIGKQPALMPDDVMKVRQRLMWEEFQEFLTACDKQDLVMIFDALLDLVYVTVGTGIACGFPMGGGWGGGGGSHKGQGFPAGAV